MSLQSDNNLPNATQLIARGAGIQVLLSQVPVAHHLSIIATSPLRNHSSFSEL